MTSIIVRLQRNARRKVHMAIKSGKLSRLSCEVCGNPKTHAHHDDYSKPLAVRWLCTKHHGLTHSQFAGKEAPDWMTDIRLAMKKSFLKPIKGGSPKVSATTTLAI
jgi:hypothetical protein